MSTFRDELAGELGGHTIGSGYYSTTVAHDEARDMIDDLLASEPMQAIRNYLRHDFCIDGEWLENSLRASLPESVIDWVMEGNE